MEEPEWCTKVCTPEQMEYGHCVCNNRWWEQQELEEQEELEEEDA